MPLHDGRADAPLPADRRPDRDADRQRRIRARMRACRPSASSPRCSACRARRFARPSSASRSPDAWRFAWARASSCARRPPRAQVAATCVGIDGPETVRPPGRASRDRRRDRRAGGALDPPARRSRPSATRVAAHAGESTPIMRRGNAADREFHVRIAQATGNGSLRAVVRACGTRRRTAVVTHRGAFPYARRSARDARRSCRDRRCARGARRRRRPRCDASSPRRASTASSSARTRSSRRARAERRTRQPTSRATRRVRNVTKEESAMKMQVGTRRRGTGGRSAFACRPQHRNSARRTSIRTTIRR